MTKLSDDEDYYHFIDRILPNRLACLVKLNDLTDNMDVRRMPEMTEKDVSGFNKYLKAYRRVSEALEQ